MFREQSSRLQPAGALRGGNEKAPH
ncbi:hypothetical protein PSEUDO8O_120668 [Pseudomonas sp. 8O]|nr:hypothetical protein PSEUDO8O_120668 [Pseudomonas sp. 8O]